MMAFVLLPAPRPPARRIFRLEVLPMVEANASRTEKTFLIGPSPFEEAIMIRSPLAALELVSEQRSSSLAKLHVPHSTTTDRGIDEVHGRRVLLDAFSQLTHLGRGGCGAEYDYGVLL